jgi:hypothetical protein
MSTEEQKDIQEEAYVEALRYMSNAKDLLQKASKDDRYYRDRKYVRSACGIAYSGALVALDAWLRLKNVPDVKRKTIDYYRKSIGQLDRKLLTELNSAYEVLHLLGYYDGNLRVPIIQDGFNIAFEIIDRLKPAQPIDPAAWAARRKKPSLARKLFPMLFA